jgi:hypothetical protein
MTLWQWIFGVGGGLVMLAFVIFSFWQGLKVRPGKGSNDTADAIALNADRNFHNPPT